MHLHTGSEAHPAPWAWVELQLIELYHCTHEELDKMDVRRCLLDLAMRNKAEEIRRWKSEV